MACSLVPTFEHNVGFGSFVANTFSTTTSQRHAGAWLRTPRRNTSTLPPARSMLAKIGNMFTVTGMLTALFDLRGIPQHAGMRVFEEDRHMVGNTSSNDLCCASHGSITISEFSLIFL